MHASPALVQAAEQGSSDRQNNDDASQLPDQRLVHRLQQLESDMTKVRLCSSLQDINQMHAMRIACLWCTGAKYAAVAQRTFGPHRH